MTRRLMSMLVAPILLASLADLARGQEPPPASKPDAPAPDLHPGPPKPIPAEEVSDAIRRGISFLLKDQSDDGSWGTPERTKGLNIMAGVGSHQAFPRRRDGPLRGGAHRGGRRHRVRPHRHRSRRGVPLPRARQGPPRRPHAHLQRLDPRLRDLGAGADARPEARRQAAQGADRGHDPRAIRAAHAVRVGRGGLGLLRLQRRHAEARVRLHQLRQRRRPGRLPRRPGDRRGAPGKDHQAGRRDHRIPAPPRFQLSLRHLPEIHAQDGDQPAGRQPGTLAGVQPGVATLGRQEGDRRRAEGVARPPDHPQRLARHGPEAADPARVALHGRRLLLLLRHYYATLCIEQLPAKERPFYQDHLANILLKVQEQDGSWWDYPLYNYHQQYGTAFAIMSLQRCRKAAPPATEPAKP